MVVLVLVLVVVVVVVVVAAAAVVVVVNLAMVGLVRSSSFLSCVSVGWLLVFPAQSLVLGDICCWGVGQWSGEVSCV